MTTTTNFQLNGASVALDGSEPTESLLRWLKRQRLTGTKEGCADGDCGACTIALVERDAHGRVQFQAANSCLLPMGALPGREVITVEALAQGDELHPVQGALVECSGSQCGYCTPGFVMSLFAGYYNGELNDETTEGNLCRCTGYRPIRDATYRIAHQRCDRDRFHDLLAAPRSALASARLADFHSPASIAEALALKQTHPQAVWIAGATDLGVNLSHGQSVAPAFIALDRIAELKAMDIGDDDIRIGAGVSLSDIEHSLAGLVPVLDQMLPWFAARQVRNRATLGGNLGSASPIGDLLPVLLALDATIHCVGPDGARDLRADAFFIDYRKTARHADELITAVTLPRPHGLMSASYKVAKRQTDDISIVAAVFALRLNAAGVVEHARLAYGGVAAIPRRATQTEAMLIGRSLDSGTVKAAVAALESEFVPLSDHRADAGYRRKLCGSLFAKFIAEHAA
jgi:xanthine dehydrogenase small subunit